MRNSTITPASFEEWLAEQAPAVIALPMQGGTVAHRRPLPAPRLDEQRLAEMASEILAMAIKLVVTLEASRHTSGVRSNSTMRAPTAAGGEIDNV